MGIRAHTLTADSTVRAARERLSATGETAVVVIRDGHPVAVVTRPAIERALAEGRADDRVDTVADMVTVPVDRSVDALTTIHAFTRAAGDWLRYDRDR